MSKKTQRIFTLTLTAIVIFLMAGLYFWTIRQEPEDDTPQEIPSTSVQLIQREEAQVTEIIFYSNGARAYMTSFIDGLGILQWAYSAAPDYILMPHLLRDKARHSWLLSAVDTAHENFADVELEMFGLSPPSLVVESVFYDGTRHRIKIGGQTTDLRHYFLMIDDDPAIYLVNAIVAQRLKYGAADMLDLSLPPVDITAAEYIRIAERGAEPIVLAYSEVPHENPFAGIIPEVGGEQLIMFAPLAGMTVSHSRLMEHVIQPISQMRLLELADLHPTDLTQFGLDSPSAEFVFITPQTEIHWKFGDTFTSGGAELIYVKTADRPHVFIAEASYAEALKNIDALNIAERFLALINITDVEKITVATPEISYEMVMNHIEGTFDIEPTVNGIPADDGAVRNVFRQIIGLAADGEIEPFVPQTAPEIIITHRRIENPDTELRFYHYNANFLAVSVDGGELMFATNRRVLGRVLEGLRALAE